MSAPRPPPPTGIAPSPNITKSFPPPGELWCDMKGAQAGKPSANQTGTIDNAAQLAQYVFGGYNDGAYGPISIAPATLREGTKSTPIHLVGISGTESVAGQATNWETNFKAGLNNESKQLANAKASIMKLPPGSTLVLAGHSQGGMIAQQLAADPDITKRFTVLQTVTFGAPLLPAGGREGGFEQVASVADPTPGMSPLGAIQADQRIKLGLLDAVVPGSIPGPHNDLTGVPGLNSIWQVHMDAYVDESAAVGKRDALARHASSTPATITFDPARRSFFTSPTE